jgi:hypothetical protein
MGSVSVARSFAAITAGFAFATGGICAFLGAIEPKLSLMAALLLVSGIWLLDDGRTR